jgi:hypothetical protein
MNTHKTDTYFPTLGTGPEELVGSSLNTYFYNAKWLHPLYRYIESGKVMPQRVRICELPPGAFIIKGLSTFGHSSFYTCPVPPGNPYVVPRHFQLFFTAGENTDRPYRGYRSGTIKSTLTFNSSEHEQQYGSLCDFTAFATEINVLKEGDSGEPSSAANDDKLDDWVVSPSLYIASGPSIKLEALQTLQLGIQYFLKLLNLAVDVQYDPNTNRWLQETRL